MCFAQHSQDEELASAQPWMKVAVMLVMPNVIVMRVSDLANLDEILTIATYFRFSHAKVRQPGACE